MAAKRSKKSEKPNDRFYTEVPRARCKYCGELLDPTEQSLRRLVERGPKAASPFYLCDCTPGELQVYPNWHRLHGLGASD